MVSAGGSNVMRRGLIGVTVVCAALLMSGVERSAVDSHYHYGWVGGPYFVPDGPNLYPLNAGYFGPWLPGPATVPTQPIPLLPRPRPQIAPLPLRNAVANPAPAPQKPARVSNAETLARARQFVRFGDEHFLKQEFNDALQRYKKGAVAAPDLAEAYFRQAWCQIALGQYSAAAKNLKRGLRLDPEWPKSQFRLALIYGDNHLAQAVHVDGLAEAAIQQPGNADLIFLVAVELYFDGQHARSLNFFQRARQLAPSEHRHIDLFLRELAVQGAPSKE